MYGENLPPDPRGDVPLAGCFVVGRKDTSDITIQQGPDEATYLCSWAGRLGHCVGYGSDFTIHCNEGIRVAGNPD